jgi:hypothetical protein
MSTWKSTDMDAKAAPAQAGIVVGRRALAGAGAALAVQRFGDRGGQLGQ